MVNNCNSFETGDCVCFDGMLSFVFYTTVLQVCSVPDIIKVKVPVCFYTILESEELPLVSMVGN